MTTHSFFLRWLATLSLSALFGCSTASDDADVSNSQTHWLKACESTNECGDLICSCGVCTRTCDEENACLAGSSCTETTTVDSCESSAPTAVCLGDDSAPGGDDDDSPPGVSCADYESCDLETPCEEGECLAFSECGGAICIDSDEACELSCPEGSECSFLTSFPGQLVCEGRVPAIADDDGDDDAPADDTPADDDTPVDDDPTPGPSAPPGVMCADYEPCSADPVTCLDCVSVPGCSTPICIDPDEFCELSCPNDDCAIGESFPGSPSCSDMVPGTPGDDDGPTDAGVSEEPSCPEDSPTEGESCEGDLNCSYETGGVTTECECSDAQWSCATSDEPQPPPGVDCSAYPLCDVDGAGCPEGDNCMALVGCELPICIPSAEACEQSCPDPATCEIQESYPEQLQCEGRVDAHGEQDDPTMSGTMFNCGPDMTCDSATHYCDAFFPGVADSPPSYTCQELPEECLGMASCECLGYESDDLSSPAFCQEGMDGDVTVTVAAP